jgi:hypothetical protein
MESTGGLTNTYTDSSEDLLASSKPQLSSSEPQLSEEESKSDNKIQETDFTDIEK